MSGALCVEYTELQRLEHEMASACALRYQRIAAAEQTIHRANVEFDRDALRLGRKINKLRAQQEAAKPTEPTSRKLDTGSHDPEWSSEDIDHYHELKRGANGRH